MTRKGRQLYDQILESVNTAAAETQADSAQYEALLHKQFEKFPDDMVQLHAQQLMYFIYRVTPRGETMGLSSSTLSLIQLLEDCTLE